MSDARKYFPDPTLVETLHRLLFAMRGQEVSWLQARTYIAIVR